MDHNIGPPEGSCRQAPDVGGVPDGGRGAEDGGELGEQVRTGDDARSVALSGLHLPFQWHQQTKKQFGLCIRGKVIVEEVLQSKRRTQRGVSWCAGTLEAFLDVGAVASQNRKPSS